MVYIFLADGFEEMEAIAPLDMLRRAKVEVKTVGIGAKIIESARGLKIEADLQENEMSFENLQMIVLPGGLPGATNLEKSETVKKAIEHCAKNELYIAAICAAPYILGKMGLLKGIRATCYPGYEKDLEGAILASESVVIDKKFITAKGAGVSTEFALSLVTILMGSTVSENISKGIQYGRTRG